MSNPPRIYCAQHLETWEGNHFRLINWGLNLVPSPAELGDETIVDNYKALVTHLRGFE